MKSADFRNLSKKDAIGYHLSLLRNIDEKTTVFSTLIALLRDCRLITGRDLETGSVMSERKFGAPGNWLGAAGYLTFLDMVGKCYRPSGSEKISNSRSISKALGYFTGLDKNSIDALFALRCAFSHDYNLYNVRRTGVTDPLNHFFTVTQGYDFVVRLPKEPWNGVHETKKKENTTYVDLFQLGNLAEDIFKQLVQFSKNDELEIELPGGPDELKDRYLVFIFTQGE